MTKQTLFAKQTLFVRIISPTNLIFQGQADSVSSKNDAGKFDILPQHANFITLIENSPIIVRTLDKKSLKFELPLAIIFTRENKVNIYTYLLPEQKTSSVYLLQKASSA